MSEIEHMSEGSREPKTHLGSNGHLPVGHRLESADSLLYRRMSGKQPLDTTGKWIDDEEMGMGGISILDRKPSGT